MKHITPSLPAMIGVTCQNAFSFDAFSSKETQGDSVFNYPLFYYCDDEVSFPSSGKEKDSESGYHYFGARYYDSEVLTGWLSVDPMMDKYPGISPYAYCAWTRPTGGDEHRWIKYNIVNNPVKMVDPDGNDWFYNEITGQIYYNSSYSIKNLNQGEGMSSGGWKYLCGNGRMYNTDAQSEMSKVYGEGGRFTPTKFDPNTGNMLGYVEFSLSGNTAERFANKHGFKKVPTQVVHYNSTYNQSASGPGYYGFIFEMGEDLQLAEKYAFVRNSFVETSRRGVGEMYQGRIEPILGCVPTVRRERITYGPSKGGEFFQLLKIMSGRHDYVKYTTIPMQNYEKNIQLINDFLSEHKP